jgi:hypothetical protein
VARESGCGAWLAALAAAVALGVPPVMQAYAQPAAPAPRVTLDRVQLERRFASVEVLLHSSSAARQVEASGDARALEGQRRARALALRARQAFEAGDGAGAAALLAEASARMFEAVRLAAPEQVTAGKLRADFDARLESVKALHEAHKRIIAEKPGVPGSVEASEAVGLQVREAERLALAGDLQAARATLDRAYLIAKAAVSSMRGGDTLVRSLHFAGKKEEYDYEIDRNDTHRMLIRMLAAEKRRDPGADQALAGLLQRATDLRGRADAAAAAGDHARAVDLLEQSTRTLIRAIRNAGLYIPG